AGLGEGTGRVVRLEGYDPANRLLSRGNTSPTDFRNGASITVTMWFAVVNDFSGVHGATVGREGPAVAALSDGRVLVAGGLVGGTAVAGAEIYDPQSDTVAAAASMTTAHAFAASMTVGTDLVLVAGGTRTGPDAVAG